MQRFVAAMLIVASGFACATAACADEAPVDFDRLNAQLAQLRAQKDRAKAALRPLQQAVDKAHAALTAARARAHDAVTDVRARVAEHNASPHPLNYDDAAVVAYNAKSASVAAEQRQVLAKTRAEIAPLFAAFRTAKARAAPLRKQALRLRDRYNTLVNRYRALRTKEFRDRHKAPREH